MDVELFQLINGWGRSSVVEAVGVFFSSKWVPILFLTPMGLYLLWRRRFAVVFTVLLVSGATDVVTSRILKPTFARERPCRALEDVHQPTGCGSGRSLPSGHASNSFAIATSTTLLAPRFGVPLIPVAVLVALSRVVVGVHYPSDIIAGGLLGVLLGGAMAYPVRRRLRRGAEQSESQSAHSDS